jgi:hypothetical protein
MVERENNAMLTPSVHGAGNDMAADKDEQRGLDVDEGTQYSPSR